MSDLTTWLRTQFDEDFDWANEVHADYCDSHPDPDGASWVRPAEDHVCDCEWPQWLRAEVEAKRRILDLHVISVRKADRPPFDPYTGQPQPDEFEVECATCGWAGGDPTAGCITLRLLALPYADSPGYQEAWRP